MASGGQDVFYRGQKEKVSRVKKIKHPLQTLSFLPVIHGKGNKAESGCAVVADRSRDGKESHADTGPDQRMPLPKYIKQEYRDNREEGVVRAQQK